MQKMFLLLNEDFDSWTQQLEQIHKLVSTAELSRDPDDFIEVRKRIAGLLKEIEQTRQWFLARVTVTEVTSDVETLFEVDRSERLSGEPQANQHQPDEYSLE